MVEKELYKRGTKITLIFLTLKHFQFQKLQKLVSRYNGELKLVRDCACL